MTTPRELTSGGLLYRGPMPSGCAKLPWKINVYRHSGRMSKSGSGLRVGKSWQRWKLYPSERSAQNAMAVLALLALPPPAPPAPKG